MSKKATIIAVVNQKGGTGKTTTTENLGVGLALEGKKVLLVDTDPQASLTVSLGNPCPDDLSPTLSDLMGKIMVESPIAPGEGILHHPEGVDLVPSNIELSGMEVALVNAMSRETILRQYLDTVKQNYDYILLDCIITYGNLLLNCDSYAATVDGSDFELTQKEFEILRELLTHQGRILTRQNLLDKLWRFDFYGDERVVDTHIKNLRKKLGIDFIQTIRGVGYKVDKEN